MDRKELIDKLRDPCPHENCVLSQEAASALEEDTKLIENLKAEVRVYHNAARLYGIDAMTMLALAKSQIKTCADNIRMTERMQEFGALFREIPENLTEQELISAIVQYDGDGSKPFCDLVYCGLDIVRKLMKMRRDNHEWWFNDLSECG